MISDSGDHIFPLVLFLFGLLEAPSSSFYFFDSLNQEGKNLPQKKFNVCAFSYFLCAVSRLTLSHREFNEQKFTGFHRSQQAVVVGALGALCALSWYSLERNRQYHWCLPLA